MAKKRVLVFAIPLLIIFSILIGGASAATVSHPASQVEAGTFGIGDFFFPGRVGINVSTITQTLDINGSINISGKYYGDGSELIGVSTTGGGNDTYNYVMNQSGAWIGMLGSSEGSLKIDLTDVLAGTLSADAIGTNLNLSGYLNILGNLNVSGTSYLGSIVISADNITTNSILSKNGNVTFYNNAGSAIAIMTSDGKVGIGTLNPGQKLEVLGNINSTGTVYADNFSSNSPLQLQTGGVTRIYVDSSNGNVGIGTTSPQKTFHIKVGTNQSIRFQSFESEVSLDTADDLQYNIPLRIYASEFNLMNGNVGIGTSSPSTTLNVNGTILFNGSFGTIRTDAGDASFASSGIALTAKAGKPYIAARLGTATSGSNFGIYDSNSAQLVTFRGDGNVGIGTASPSEKLEIEQSTDGAVSMRINNPNTGTSARSQYVLSATGNTASIQSYLQALPTGFTLSPDLAGYIRLLTSGSGNGLIIQSKLTSGGIQFWVGDTDTRSSGEKMRITSSGNVGIGTATPVTMLQVTGNATFATSSGNVGIGTASPQTALHIFKGSPGAVLRLETDTTSNTLGVLFRNYVGGTNFIHAKILAERDGGAESTVLTFFTQTSGSSGDTSTEKMRITSGGNVGIGTASPASQLEVKGTSNDRLFTLTDTNQNNAAKYFSVYVSGSGGAPDNEFTMRNDGNAYADGAWNGGGADYAEWFEKEGDIKAKDIVGLNMKTGKVRKYQKGDVLVGVYSENPGFVGNRDIDKTDEEMAAGHALVSLMGQVNINAEQINITGNNVYTKDSRMLGYLLSNGKVLLKIK